MNYRMTINVVGGSASTAFALDDPDSAWPALVARQFNAEVRQESQSGLTMVRSLDLIDSLPQADILILHLGTSVAWPKPVIELGARFGMDFHNETAFHQTPHGFSGRLGVRLSKQVRLRLRNSIKYLLFIVGAYRPKISIREIEDQVKAVLALSTKRAKRVVWIQHRSLQTMRLLIERSVYERYYRRLVRAVRANVNDSFEFIELERSFLVGRNYLLDGVHLSEEGHSRLAEIVGAKISP